METSMLQREKSPNICVYSLMCCQHAHVGNADFSQNVSQSLVIFISSNEDKGCTVGNLGTQSQNEEAFAFGIARRSIPSMDDM